MIKIAPSILSVDFGRLSDQVRAAEAGGADWIHLDVMDGHFVPNITIGPLIAASVRKSTDLPLDAHLMISNPESFIRSFVDAGVDSITVHVEATRHLHRVIQLIRDSGARAGVALNPSTPVESLVEILPFVDLILVMSVNPGFGGQTFIDQVRDKIRRVRHLLEAGGFPATDLQVDGGIHAGNIAAAVAAGANTIVAGSAIFNSDGSVADNIRALRMAAEGALRTGPFLV